MRETSRPLPFLPTVRGVFGLALEGMVWSRRSIFMAVLLGLPMLFALIYRVAQGAGTAVRSSGFDLYGQIVAFYYVRMALLPGVLPLAALFYATALVADEVEDRTITYLFTRPIRRPAILVGKFAAYLVTTLCLTLPTLVVTFFALTTARGTSGLSAFVPNLFRDMGVLALTLLVYGAFFMLMGIVLRRPLILGLLFLFIWELIYMGPGIVPRFTLASYVWSLVSYHPPQEGLGGILGQVLPSALCLQVLGVVTALCLGAAAWIFSHREYVLDQ
jgi:ABC-2 type transport system permease protein